MNVINRFAAIGLSAIALVAARPAHAQASRWFASAGIGQGSGWPTCGDCTGISHRQGLTEYIRLGGFVTPQIGLGLEYNKWNNSSNDADSQFQSGLVIAQLSAPTMPGLSLHIGAGVGGSIIRFNGCCGELTSTGFAYLVGAGYDFPVTHQVAITPFVDYLATAGASENYSAGPASGTLNGNVLRFGIGLTVR